MSSIKPEPITIDGREGVIVFLDAKGLPVDPQSDDAVVARAIFDDGGRATFHVEPKGGERKDLGGPGSGNFGHAGRIGEIGGSAPDDDGEGPIGPAPTRFTSAKAMTREPIPKTVKEADDRIRGEKNEHGVVLMASGRVLRVGNDQPDHIMVPREEAVGLVDSVFTHNHPGGRGLSVEDGVVTAFYNLKEMRAVTTTGTHSIRRTGSEWPPTFQDQLRDMNDRVHREFSQKIRKGRLSVREAEATHHATVYHRLSKETGAFTYTFEAL